MYFDFPLPLNSYCSQGLMEVSRYLLGYFFFFLRPFSGTIDCISPCLGPLGLLACLAGIGRLTCEVGENLNPSTHPTLG